MLLTRDCSVSSAHSCSVQFHFRLQHRQLQLSVQAGTVRKRERESRNDVYDRKSFYDAHSTMHSALHREVAGGGLSMKMEETVGS